MTSDAGLYCSRCGCFYMSLEEARKLRVDHVVGRKAGDVCDDRSGGLNTEDSPCTGTLELSEYTDEVRRKQLVSLQETQ